MIAPYIKVLNELGYTTFSCCSGAEEEHNNKKEVSHIAFSIPIETPLGLDDLDYYFKYLLNILDSQGWEYMFLTDKNNKINSIFAFLLEQYNDTQKMYAFHNLVKTLKERDFFNKRKKT